jgi:hypothetical protein
MKSIDFSEYDAIIFDDCRIKWEMHLDKFYQEAKKNNIIVFSSQHGNRDHSKALNEIVNAGKAFDYCFVFGNKMFDFCSKYKDSKYYLKTGIPANDKLSDYDRKENYILVVSNFLGTSNYKGFEQLDESFILNSGLKILQDKYNKEVVVKLKSRDFKFAAGHSYGSNKDYVEQLLSKYNIDGRVICDVEDDNKLICESFCVVGSVSTLCLKSIQFGIPTVVIRGTGCIGNYDIYNGFVDLNIDKIVGEIDRQLNSGKDIDFINSVIEGGLDYTSTEKTINSIINILK